MKWNTSQFRYYSNRLPFQPFCLCWSCEYKVPYLDDSIKYHLSMLSSENDGCRVLICTDYQRGSQRIRHFQFKNPGNQCLRRARGNLVPRAFSPEKAWKRGWTRGRDSVFYFIFIRLLVFVFPLLRLVDKTDNFGLVIKRNWRLHYHWHEQVHSGVLMMTDRSWSLTFLGGMNVVQS